MGKYLSAFGISYLIATAAVAVIANLLESGASMNVVALMAAGFYVAAKFVKDHGRVPGRGEKHQLVWGSFAVACLVSFILAAAYFGAIAPRESTDVLVKALPSIPPWVWLAGPAAFTLIYVLTLYACYGWYAGIVARHNARS